MKKFLNILVAAFIPFSIALSEENLESIETAEAPQINNEGVEWFNGIRGFLGFSGGYMGSQYDEKKPMRINQSYLFFKRNLPIKYAFSNLMISDSDGKLVSEHTPFRGYTLNIVFGAEAFFLQNYLGLRLEGGIGYTDLTATLIDLEKQIKREGLESYWTTSLGLDLIGNIYVGEEHTIGVFAGVETSYSSVIKATRTYSDGKIYDLTKTFKEDPSMIDIFARLGISTLLYGHHRVEFIAKIPVAYVLFKLNTERVPLGLNALEKTSINAAYKYVF